MQKCLAAMLITLIAGSPASDVSAQKKKAKLKTIKPEAIKLSRPVDFQKDVIPILEANCQACHFEGGAEGKLVLEDLKSIMKGGKRGPAIVPKQPDKSLLYLVASRAKRPAMPPLPNKVDARALTPREVGLIRQWILEGATGGSGKMQKVVWAPIPSTLNGIYSVAVSPWARFAAAGRANQITIYNLVSGTQTARLSDPALADVQFQGKAMYPGGAAHRDFVHSLAFSPDGRLLASGGFRTVKLWQHTLGARKYAITAGNAVTSLAVSSDRKTAAIGSADKSIRLFDPATGKTGKTLVGHSGPITGLQFSADGKKLVSGSTDKTVRVWDVASGTSERIITAPAAVNDVTFNKDATRIISAHADNLVRVWTTAKPKPKPEPKAKKKKKAPKKTPPGEQPILQLKGHSKPVTSVALLLPAGAQVVTGSEDGTVRTWNLANGRVVRSMNHGSPVVAVAARPDGQAVASAGRNGIGKLWQTSNGKQLAELKGRIRSLHTVASALESQQVAKNQLAAAVAAVKSADKTLKDREAALKKAKDAKTKADKAYAAAQKKAKPLNDKVAAAKAAFAKKPKDKGLKKKLADAQKAAKKPNDDLKKAKATQDAADRAVKLGATSVTRAKQQQAAANTTKTAADARKKQADARVAAANAADKTVAKPLTSIVFSADGKTIATGEQGGAVLLWGAANGQALDAVPAGKAAVNAVAFGPNGWILAGSADKTLAAVDAQPTWKLVARLGVPQNQPLDLSASPFIGRVLSLAFSRDGKRLATGGGEPSRSGELLIWDVQKRSLVREIPDAHSDTILGVQFNWDGSQILSGAADKFAKIFDVKTGKHIRSFEGHTHHVLDVAWQADGAQIATAGADNVIKIWNVATGEQRRTIGGYKKQVTSVQFIGVGANIVACAGDKQVRFHRTNNGQPYRSFSGFGDYVYAAAAARNAAAVIKNVSSEATVVVAGGEDGILRVWDGARGASRFTFQPPKSPDDKTQASVSKAGN
ncbi:MAG: c-type cytochrome domain-containing protein [Planctomycetaceae bacterium]